jgi:hypothetical protein
MTEKRVQFSNIVKNQLPSYVREEFPLISEFLSQYYISQEFTSAPVDLIQNIDQYVKVDNLTNSTDYAFLSSTISDIDTTIPIDLGLNKEGTSNFPKSYGLIQIDDEIITYTGITTSSFTGCVRGFSGITSYTTQNIPDQLTFKSTESATHSKGTKIINLSSLFLKEFLSKIKYQLSPGFEDRSLYTELDQSIFLKQIKDFYQSKGTDESFKILFKVLYGKEVKVINPKENLFRPSDAHYRLTNDIVVESIFGDPSDLTNQTLYQNDYLNISYARSPITYVEKIISGIGNTYYKLSLDSGYNRDLIANGATIGKFTVHPTTKIVGPVSSGATVFDVDSTVGFPINGELLVNYGDQTTGVVTYSSKSLTQFFGCSGVTKTIPDFASIGINTYAHAYNTDGSLVKLRVTSVLNSTEILGNTRYHYKNDTSVIRTLGVNSNDVYSKDWFFNIPISYNVKSILSRGTGDTYNITTENKNIFKIGDEISIISSSGSKILSTIIDLISSSTFTIKGQGIIDLSDRYTIKKNISKTNSTYFSNISKINSNTQNVYKLGEKTLITSPSIPSYYKQTLDATDRSIVFSGTFSGNVFTITSNWDHGFYTGDCIYYTPEVIYAQSTDSEGITSTIKTTKSFLFDEGIYFVKRIDENRISLAKSRTNIFNNIFISLLDNTTVTNNKIEIYEFKFKTLNTQKLLRELSSPIDDGNVYDTKPGFTGILLNGVEILNYKSSESIYYGKIEEIEVTASGSNYDVINPPILSITDSIGTGATGFCAVRGSLQEIRIIDPGFDYLDTPIIKVTGGNGIGAKAYANMKLVEHESIFNSQGNANLIGIGSALSTIGFTTYHKFRNAERVIYKTDGQRGVGGLSTDASYFVSIIDDFTIKLHKNLDDAIVGINTITLLSYGIGNHKIKSYDQKSIIGSINIENPGSGYENKKRTTTHIGINTSLSQIEIKNHNYNSGEKVVYTTDFTPIGGLTTNTEYIVTKINDDSFKLSAIGIGSVNYDFYYNTKQYIKFNSSGLGTHVFNYPEIKVEIIGNIGISSIGNKSFNAEVQPIFRGQITSVHLTSGGIGYGSSEIINFYRQPSFVLKSGKSAQLNPIVSTDGKITEVLIDNTGSEYNSPPSLIINGTGTGAVLTPIITNNQLTSVKVIENGIGYSPESTSVDIIPSGSSAEFVAKIQSWTINLFKKYYSSITSDDGIISNGLNESFGLQYSHLYAPRKLREIIQPSDQSGNKVYGKTDLIKQNNVEVDTTSHSPIIGWAYDGNPIYGPYGYITKTGGVVTQLKSGYDRDESPKPNRPSINSFDLGFFVEDFTFYKKSDDRFLDENNGRFCVTPEFPEGTYAYFSTLEEFSDSSGKFATYKQPKFPYLIGNYFKSKPIEFNFAKKSNQDDIDLNETGWLRNTYFYNLINDEASYSYITAPNNLNQTIDVEFASPGSVESIGIVTGGQNYKVNDSIIFNNTGTQGYNLSAKISKIEGKYVSSVSVASSTISNAEIYPTGNNGDYIIIANEPHNFKNGDFVSVYGLNTTSSLIEGSYKAGISTNILSVINSGTVVTGIESAGVTGIITYIKVSGNLKYPNIKENDILSIENEKLKVLNVDSLNSRIRVIRSYQGTIGSAHTSSTQLKEDSRKLIINVGYKTSYDYRINTELYFDPIDSVGLGSLSGVGIGTTITFSNPGAGITQIFIPTKTIYIPNHGLETGDLVTYSNNGGLSLVVSSTGIGTTTLANQSNVYVAKISNDLIGISTVQVGLGSTGTFVGIASTQRSQSTLYFMGLGSGVYHSFKTNFDVISGTIERNLVTVSCSSTHGLNNNDTVYVNVNPSISTTFTVKYNDYNRKIGINPKTFVSVGVNTFTNTITIQDHQLYNGQKVIHTSSSPAGGLQSEKEYYVIRVDKNNIKLSDTFYTATIIKPIPVGITSSSFGTILPVNPPITLYKNSTAIFDLADSSLSYANQSQRYPAFSLDFYKDSNFTQKFESSKKKNQFEVQKTGIVGVTSDAKVTLTINDDIPNKLYYKLTPVYDDVLPEEKKKINIDSEVIFNNQIEITSSKYNGKQTITSLSSTSFTYTLPQTPENIFYADSSSNIEYNTDSINALGPIFEVEIVNKGRNYYALPGISTIVSQFGKNALLEASSYSIGNIKKTKINDIGFDFPSDFTLRPSISLNQIVKIEPLSSLKSVGINSFGRGYNTSPKLLVFDGKTNELIPEIDLKYTLGSNDVEIRKNAYSLSNVSPIILPIQNSNGVGIGSIKYNSLNKEVTVTLSVGFSTSDSFPFKVNDKVMIENVSVGVGSTGIGYNSENYNYKLFTLTSVTENRGGIGSVSYSLNGLLSESQVPGNYDPVNSSGRIIPEKYFPTFNVELQKNNYFIGENIKSNSTFGYVDGWNPITNQLRAVSKENFIPGEIVEGLTSKTQGIASLVDTTDSFFNLDSSSLVNNGWQTSAGFLNLNSERIQDSDFYQNFSYSIKSSVSYDSWKDAVSTLNHTTGFKKFSEYQLETKNSNSMSIGISTEKTYVDVVVDIVGSADLNCVTDFDLVKENSLSISERYFSDEITFSSRILTDYFESIGNRVLSIDDISSQFSSNPRFTRFSEVHRFSLFNARAQKYVTFVSDRRFTGQRQLMLVSLLHSKGVGYLNQYARLESSYDLGSFDFFIEGTEGVLTFNPVKYSINNYNITTLSYNLKDSMLGIGTSSFGDFVIIKTSSEFVSSGSTSIVGIGTTYNSAKVLVEIAGSNGQYEFDELNIVHDGINVELLQYGQITNDSLNPYSSSGLGTYHPYISGSELKIDFYPNTGIAVTINTFQTLLGGTFFGIDAYDMKHAELQGISTSILSSISPTETPIIEYLKDYDCSYCLIQVADTTNNRYQLSEIVLLDDQTDENPGETYILEFGNIETNSGLGTFGFRKNGLVTELTFTPLPNIDTRIVGFSNALRHQDDEKDILSLNNGSIETNYGTYFGTESDIKRDFPLNHKGNQIFKRDFDGSSPLIVNTSLDTITIPNHFFVTGEKITYTNPGAGTTQSIGIGTTDFGVGIGITNKLPSTVYIVKVNENTIKLAKSAEDALKFIPKILDLTSVGIGTTHTFTANNQNAKAIIAIDNIIQSPITSTAQTTILSKNVFTTDDLIYVAGITSFFGGDLIKIGNEIMKIESVGVANTNIFRVRRPWMGTTIAGYSTGTLVTKVVGNYNIIDNTLNFSEAPYGNVPLSNSTESPDERDWVGITTSSKFQGRTFLKSGISDSANETYYRNYIFDDISEQFNGKTKSFTLKSNGSNTSDISSENSIILINDIFQGPGLTNNYYLTESIGITSITFVGGATSIAYDVNTASIPAGGIIISVGSTEGFGYQPLVSAGGTAIVSGLGTISSVSIGNSGSGYRSGLQTVRVGVATSSTDTLSIQFIGTAIVNNGHIVGVSITNPGTGYTSSNPPYVIIDDPLSYSDLPLIYSADSLSGLGSQATIDVVVGQGSSVIDFEIKNLGYGYGQGEILTVSVGGTVGIPTDPTKTFKEFQISIQKTITDKFTGWSIGELQVLDTPENLFDGSRTIFPLLVAGSLISLRSAIGSNINIQDNLLVFLNDVLQVPGIGFEFAGGSVITFTEPPRIGDTCKIIFYKGTGSVDVIERNILETIKSGDELTIGYDAILGQTELLQETERTVDFLKSVDLVKTLPYYGPGLSNDSRLVRPVTWCRQTEDKIINEKEVGKDRELYEPIINPFAYIIKSVGIGSTTIYVDNLKPFFDSQNENDVSLTFQKSIKLISQDPKSGAIGTAIVSGMGTILSVAISDGGVGYTTATVSFGSTIGVNTSTQAFGSAIISAAGTVAGISITNPGSGYTSTNPPSVLISSPTPIIETNQVSSYSGDSGIIVGFGTTTQDSIDKFIFDLYIPEDSFLRNQSLVGTAITISSLNVNDYFVVYDSNVGLASTSIKSLDFDTNVIGVGTQFIDNVYQVDSIFVTETDVVGIGTTFVKRIYTRITGIGITIDFSSTNITFDSEVFKFDSLKTSGSGYTGIITTSPSFGNFSWGKIDLKNRSEENQFNFYGNMGIGGITTSAVVQRTSSLKFRNYIV